MYYTRKSPERKETQETDNSLSAWGWWAGKGLAATTAAYALYANSDGVKRVLREPSVIAGAVSAIIPAGISAYVTFRLNGQRTQEEQNQYSMRNTYLQIERSEKELNDSMQSGDFHTASRCAEILFHAYLEMYGAVPNKSSAKAIEKKINEVRYAKALALTNMGKYKVDDYAVLKQEEDNAFCILDNILKEDPKNIMALNLRGLIYLESCLWDNAVRDFTTSLDEYPNQNIITIMKLYATIKNRPKTSFNVPKSESIIQNKSETSIPSAIKEPEVPKENEEKGKEETFVVTKRDNGSNEKDSIESVGSNQFFLFSDHTNAQKFANRIVSKIEIPDKRNIFSIALCEIYARSNMSLNLFENAVAHCILGICSCGNNPVFRKKQLEFYKLMSTCYKEIEKRFDEAASSSNSSSSTQAESTITIPTYFGPQKQENLTRKEVQERISNFEQRIQILSIELDEENSNENQGKFCSPR